MSAGTGIPISISAGIYICHRLPLPDTSLEGIFTKHCLEHISYGECATVLRGLGRLLNKGGTLRVIVPDGGLYLDLNQKSLAGKKDTFPYLDEVRQRDLAED
jgi:predicted SAM-dependent methyltransferase